MIQEAFFKWVCSSGSCIDTGNIKKEYNCTFILKSTKKLKFADQITQKRLSMIFITSYKAMPVCCLWMSDIVWRGFPNYHNRIWFYFMN